MKKIYNGQLQYPVQMMLHDDSIRKILETTVEKVSYEREKRIIDEKEISGEYELLNEKNSSDVNVSDEPSNRTISDEKKTLR